MKNEGVVLFTIRIFIRLIRKLANKLSTLFWSFSLKDMGSGCVIEYGVTIDSPKNILIGNNVYIGKGTVIGSELNNSQLNIEDEVHIGRNCRIDYTGGIIIGRKTLLSEYTTIFSHSHGVDPRSKPIGIELIIGERVWVGYRATILEGAKVIADGCIIGAGSIVTSDCEKNNVLYAGIPACCKKILSSHKVIN